VGKAPCVDRAHGLPVGCEGELVLLEPADLELLRDVVARAAHVHVLEGAQEPVVDHRVDGLDVAEPVAEARAGQEVRRACHGFHPAGHHDLGGAGLDRLDGAVDGFHPGAADHADLEGRHGVRQPGAERDLAGGVLPEARGEHIAHDDMLDALRVDLRA